MYTIKDISKPDIYLLLLSALALIDRLIVTDSYNLPLI
jgi:hypothetical protein